MAKSLLRTDKEIAEIYHRHVKTVYRVCFAYMRKSHDAEDAVQDTFLKMITSMTIFVDEEHEKAWLIRTAINACKDVLKHWWLKRENIDGYERVESGNDIQADDTFESICALPDKYKAVILLYYYEGYTSVEIAHILCKPTSTIRNYLSEARKLLRKNLGGGFDE